MNESRFDVDSELDNGIVTITIYDNKLNDKYKKRFTDEDIMDRCNGIVGSDEINIAIININSKWIKFNVSHTSSCISLNFTIDIRFKTVKFTLEMYKIVENSESKNTRLLCKALSKIKVLESKIKGLSKPYTLVFKRLADFKISHAQLTKFGIDTGIASEEYIRKEYKLEDMMFKEKVFTYLLDNKSNLNVHSIDNKSSGRYLSNEEENYLDTLRPKVFDENGIMNLHYRYHGGRNKILKYLDKKHIHPANINMFQGFANKEHYEKRRDVIFNMMIINYLLNLGYETMNSFIHSDFLNPKNYDNGKELCYILKKYETSCDWLYYLKKVKLTEILSSKYKIVESYNNNLFQLNSYNQDHCYIIVKKMLR